MCSLPPKKEKNVIYKFEESTDPSEERVNVVNDLGNIFLLVFLYMLQGVPLGLTAAIPIILQNRHVSYTDQAGFSIVSWPFSFKILWAPVVDAVYSVKFGRRKSWLVPVQYLIGLCMLFISMNVDKWLGDEEGEVQPKIIYLTMAFFVCKFFVATQDVVVDGWALTMLHRKNVGYSSLCCSIGVKIGYFFGYVVFLVLDSADFCNKWIRSTPQSTGIVSLASYLYYWSIVYIIFNTLVAIFKKDDSLSIVEDHKEIEMTVKESYQLLLKILQLKPVQNFAVILLTCNIAFAAAFIISPLKLVEVGVSKDKIALLSVPLMIFQILSLLLMTRYLVGPRPLNVFLITIPYRLFCDLLLTGFVYITPALISSGISPGGYFILLIVPFGISNIAVYCMTMSTTAYFAKVSDPRFGGIYMTLLNTLYNLGGVWPQTLSLWLEDWLTFKRCRSTCKVTDKELCSLEEICEIFIDGYYIQVIVGILIGIIWLKWNKNKIIELQNLDDSCWLVNSRVSIDKC